VVVGSEGGGLKDAIGPCGRTFRNGDTAGLAGVLAEVLRHPEADGEYRRHAESHLAGHTRDRVMSAHLAILEEVLARRSPQTRPAA
jgi:hypothetical protein